MSRAPHDAINVRDAGIGDNQYPPQSAPNQASHGMSNFIDGSGPIFSMYLEMATEEDKKMAENWKADADGILIFTGLFSAAVASLISVSIQDIRPNPQDTSNFYLANIYQTVADPNRSNDSSSLPTSPPSFTPPNYAVWVNALWFLSLVISITSALLATLLQQWARRYLKVTQPRYSTHKRARIRAFFSEGVEKFLLPWAVEALPTLLHVSLFLFFAGLTVFLCNINLTIFKLVLSWVGACTALYGCITFIPIFCHDSPYHTPLSLPAWHVLTAILFVVFRVLRGFAEFQCFSFEVWSRMLYLERSYHKFFVRGMQKTAEETALNSPSEIDTRAFMWTFDSMDEDHELERFFSSLPGFRNSKVVDDPLPGLTKKQKLKLLMGLVELLNLTFSSDLLPDPIKSRRANICAKAIDPTGIPHAYWHIVNRILSEDQYTGLQTTEFGRIMKGWKDSGDQGVALVAQAIHMGFIARSQKRDNSWFFLASDELDLPESVLRNYAAHGDSLSLAILIHIIRRQLDHQELPWPGDSTLSDVLKAASEFNARDTSHDLQLEFCALWNQAVLKANNDDVLIAWYILRPIRDVYIALHHDTSSAPTQFSPSTNDWDVILRTPSPYPSCNVPGHRPADATSRVHEVSASTTSARAVMHDSAALFPVPFTSSSDAPSSTVPAPIQVAEGLAYVPPLDNISVPVSLQPASQTIIETLRIPATSHDSVTTRATMQRGTDVTARSMPLSTPELSASSHPSTSKTSTTLPGAVTLHQNASPSDVPDNPSSPLGLNITLATDPPSSSDSAASPGSDHMLAPALPGPPPPRPISAPDLDAPAEGEDSARVSSREDNDAFDLTSAIRNNTSQNSLDPKRMGYHL
ncbi:hypothetical protein EDB87DRAFT_1691245 [Lactarius vividus]|nr:hypothetical protein EDB87DRAFT_1691245 [Lactarius vividus]